LHDARESEPVFARGDDLAATLKVRQCFRGIAGIRNYCGQPGPGEQLTSYVSTVDANLKRPLPKSHALCALSVEPVQTSEGKRHHLACEVLGPTRPLEVCSPLLACQIPLALKEQEVWSLSAATFGEIRARLGEFTCCNQGAYQHLAHTYDSVVGPDRPTRN